MRNTRVANTTYARAPLIAECYDSIQAHRQRNDIPFFLEMARRAAGPVLELACGTGRILLPLARAGVEIVGLDSSRWMLAACRRKLAGEPREVRARVRLVRGDMRRFDLRRKFPLVMIPFASFQFLTEVKDQIACLGRVHRHLAPGGRLILDLLNPPLDALAGGSSRVEFEPEPEFELEDGRRVVRHLRVLSGSLSKQIVETETEYVIRRPNGRTQRAAHRLRLRYLFRYEAEHLLARCGFRVEKAFGDFNKKPYGREPGGSLILVARKQ